MIPDRKQAERIILEILRIADGKLNKTLVYKAFWIAHLYYNREEPGFLTDWPVVKMERGPGIHQGDEILHSLVVRGLATLTFESAGPCTESIYRAEPLPPTMPPLPVQAVKAISDAVDFLKGKTAAYASRISHDYSRSWNSKPIGAELDIYTDQIPDEIYDERRKQLGDMKAAYEAMLQ